MTPAWKLALGWGISTPDDQLGRVTPSPGRLVESGLRPPELRPPACGLVEEGPEEIGRLFLGGREVSPELETCGVSPRLRVMELGSSQIPVLDHLGLGSACLPEAQVWLLLAGTRSQKAVSAPSVSQQLVKWRHTCWFADCGWEDRMWWKIAHQL